MSARPLFHGVLVMDKPEGLTSHDVVAHARRALGIARIGHLGTLDPLATGVLPLTVGRATRLGRFLTGTKEYDATIRLGFATDTYDRTGTAVGVQCPSSDPRWPDDERLTMALTAFQGRFLQKPPPFSAKKIKGVRAYRLARRQLIAPLREVPVSVDSIELLSHSDELVRVRIICTPGTYIRAIAHDLGQALGCGAHLDALRRLRSGRFTVQHALTLDQVSQDQDLVKARVLDIETLVASFPAVILTALQSRRVTHGQEVTGSSLPEAGLEAEGEEPVRLLDSTGRLLALARQVTTGLYRPVVVLADFVG